MHITENHTYVGVDGLDGFRLGQRYELRFTRRKSNTVAMAIDQVPGIRQISVITAQFEQ